MGAISELLKPIPLPKMFAVEQIFDDTHIPVEEIPAVIREGLARPEIADTIKPGMRIAITAGSRGVSNIALIIRSIVDFLKEKEAKPFIVPAMGSHGGATAEGQLEVLSAYNITEETMGCPLLSSMETVVLGLSENGKEVHCDKNAAEADGIIVVGRVKPHTAFRGPYESGVMKMMAIGLGKQKGASILHNDGFGLMGKEVPMFGKVFLEKANILCGIAIVENAYDHTRELVALTPQEIIDKEPEILLRAKSYMAKILLDDKCDLLVIDKIGKNISGDGMDPNITGVYGTRHASGGLEPQKIAVLDLTDETHGNANGIGLANSTTRRAFEKMDFEATYPNCITSTLSEPIKIPMVLYTDKESIQFGIRSCHHINREDPRIIRIESTMNMKHLYYSENYYEEAKAHPQIKVLEEPKEFAFDEKGNLF